MFPTHISAQRPRSQAATFHVTRQAFGYASASPHIYKPSLPRPPSCSLALFAFWLRSSVVSVLSSLNARTCLRTHLRLFLFLHLDDGSLGLPTVVVTVSPVLHYFRCTRTSLFIEMLALCWCLRKRLESWSFSSTTCVAYRFDASRMQTLHTMVPAAPAPFAIAA